MPHLRRGLSLPLLAQAGGQFLGYLQALREMTLVVWMPVLACWIFLLFLTAFAPQAAGELANGAEPRGGSRSLWEQLL